MVATGDAQLQRAQGPSGLGRFLSGFLSATSRPRSKGSFGYDNAFYFHPQFKRWVERGKEDVSCSTTTDLPPPPMMNCGIEEAPKRRSVAQRYKLQDNLRVSSASSGTWGSDGLVADSPLPPEPPVCGSGVTLPALRHTEDPILNSGPPSACSDCSSTDSSGSPSTRSSSLVSFANDVRAALASGSASSSKGNSASSSRAGSACGSTEDTASSPEVADDGFHDFWGLGSSPFCKADCGPGISLLRQQPQALEPGKVDCQGAGSVSILCTVDSALLAAHQQGQFQQASQPFLQGLPAANQRDARGSVSGELSPHDVATCGSADECGAVLSRSSSLALSFADFVHHDSLPEVDLHRELQLLQHQHQRQHLQQHAGENADDIAVMCGGRQLQQGQQPELQSSQWAFAAAIAPSADLASDAFSFTPVFEPVCLEEPRECDGESIQASATVWGTAAPSAGGGKAGLPRASGDCELQPSWGLQPGPSVAIVAKVALSQAPAPEATLRESADEERQVEATSANVATECSASTSARSAAPPCPAGAGAAAAVDMAAVDSAVQLLKQLRGSLMTAGSCAAAASCVRAQGLQAGGGNPQAAPAPQAAPQSSARPVAVAAAGISASLAQAAQKLAGIGLLPLAPPPPPPLPALAAAVTTEPETLRIDTRRAVPTQPACKHGLGRGAAGVNIDKAQGMTSTAAQTELSASDGPLVSSSRCKAFLRRMQADWSRVHDHIGDIVCDYTALAKQVTATAVKQIRLERCCAIVEERQRQLERQLEQERERRQALEQLLEQERLQRRALEQEHGLAGARVGELEAEAGGLRSDMDELLLCLGQESTKVSVLAEALRAAGGDPDSMIEQVEAEFVAKGVCPA